MRCFMCVCEHVLPTEKNPTVECPLKHVGKLVQEVALLMVDVHL